MNPDKTYTGRSTINMYRGDCIDLMKSKPDNYYSLCIVDPPYGIDFAKTHTGKGWVVRENKEWDKKAPDSEYFNYLCRVSENQIVFGANYMTTYLPPSQGWVFWDKGQRNFSLADGELIYTSFDRALRVFKFTRGEMQAEYNGVKFHPTTKPVQLYKWLLTNYAKQGDTILDTHGGSMSIAIACWDLGFDLDIIELDPDYFNDAVKRFENHISQTQLF